MMAIKAQPRNYQKGLWFDKYLFYPAAKVVEPSVHQVEWETFKLN